MKKKQRGSCESLLKKSTHAWWPFRTLYASSDNKNRSNQRLSWKKTSTLAQGTAETPKLRLFRTRCAFWTAILSDLLDAHTLVHRKITRTRGKLCRRRSRKGRGSGTSSGLNTQGRPLASYSYVSSSEQPIPMSMAPKRVRTHDVNQFQTSKLVMWRNLI